MGTPPIDMDASIAALKRQRDIAMDDAAALVGRVAYLERVNTVLRAELDRRLPQDPGADIEPDKPRPLPNPALVN